MTLAEFKARYTELYNEATECEIARDGSMRRNAYGGAIHGTESKESAAALRKAQIRFQEFLEHVGVEIYWDGEGFDATISAIEYVEDLLKKLEHGRK